jgi:hypothetical protein
VVDDTSTLAHWCRYRWGRPSHCLRCGHRPIVVFWIETPGEPGLREFDDGALLEALKFAEAQRGAGRRHVTLSSELASSVGKAGVDAVEQGQLPDGAPYEFNKRHRAAGFKPKT